MTFSDQATPTATDNRVCLSLCMIVRDSSRTLAASLESIRPWVDELVVVDTGSQDETCEIAKSYGARLFHFPWCDSFAAARNESLRYAQGQWIFWMDSDDTIDEANGRKLRELSKLPLGQSPMAYVMQVHCPGSGNQSRQEVTVVDHIKLFRNLPELRFEFRIHEQVLPAIRRLEGQVAWTDVFVVHSGSDRSDEGRQRKQQRDLRLLELELNDRPNHPFTLFNLGMTYGDMNRHQEAIGAIKLCLKVSSAEESHVRKAYALLVGSLASLELFDDAWQSCNRGLELFPDDVELQFRKGLVAHRRGQLDIAVEAYRTALSGSKERHFSSIDRGITGYKARHNLAIVYAEQERHDLSELQWRQVIAEVADYRPGWHGLGQALLRQRRFATVAAELDKFSALPGLSGEAALLRSEMAKLQGDINGAARELVEGAANSPDDLELLRACCQFLFEHGSLQDAERALLELCQQEPYDGAAYHNLGTLYVRMQCLNKAVEAYRQSLAVRPNHHPTQEQLDGVLAQLTQFEASSSGVQDVDFDTISYA